MGLMGLGRGGWGFCEVQEKDGGLNGSPYSIRASIMKANIATLGSRMKNVFVIISCKDQNFEDAEYRQFLAGSVHQALRSVLNRFSVSQEILGARKRRRVSIFSSSSLEDFL